MTDTAVKRFSALNVGAPWRGIAVIPDGTISAGDRASVSQAYGGISFGYTYTIGCLFGSFVMTGNSAELIQTTNIDTVLERFAAINVGSPWRGINLIPSGTIGRTQRQIAGGFYVPYVTGPTYTLEALTGSFAWTGEPSFSDFEISGIAGEFAMVGSDATLLATRTLFATAGVFTMTGNDANLNYFIGRTLLAQAGEFAMTGYDVVFDRPRSLGVESGVFETTGYESVFTWFDANGEIVPLPAVIVNKPGGFTSVRKRNYIIKGRRYYDLTEEELRSILAMDAEIEREQVKVAIQGKKPHPISKALFEEVKPKPIESEDEEEAFLLL